MDILNPMVIGPIVAVIVILGGAGFAFVQSQRGKATERRIEQWAAGAYSLWTGGEDSASWPEERAASSLANWYGADSAAKFSDVIAGLRRGQTGNPAWDQIRALDLLRMGLAAGHLDAEDCRKELASIGRELQQKYRSWAELAQAFEAGMNAWQHGRGVTDPNELGRVRKNLPRLEREVWPRIRYDASLVLED